MWKPEKFEKYYFILSDGEICDGIWDGDERDLQLYNRGNIFKTEELARECDKKIKLAFIAFQKGF